MGIGKHRQRHELWLKFLTCSNAQQVNTDTLSEYFLRNFGATPQRLYDFLQFLHYHMRYLKKAEDREWLARQYLRILSPLCERFSLFEEKERMDTLCFRITEPEKYREMAALLSRYRSRSRSVIRRIFSILRSLLERTGQSYELQGRYKSLYSVHRKLQMKGSYQSPLHLSDIFAFRIILRTKGDAECFEILNLLHDTFHPIPGKFKDYITVPKINGYQSLHTILNGVIDDLDLPIEVQIRTEAMHQFAQQGVAAHWLYARSKRVQRITEKEQQLMLHFASLSKQAEREELVYCLTPGGDVLRMPAGCTILDVAYRIHTEIGDRASGAIVNGQPRAMRAPVRAGDQIHIVTASSPQVTEKWLTHATLPHTRRTIYAHTRS